MRKILFFVFFFLCLYSCLNKNRGNVSYCEVVKSIEEYPDSSFFMSIKCMEYSDGRLYILDEKRGDVVALDSNLSTMKYISRHGEAPYETVMPLTFSVWKDTTYVVDLGTRSMKKYYDGKLWDDFSLSNANAHRFSVNESFIFLAAATDSTCFLGISLQNPSLQTPEGMVVKESTPRRTIMLNEKHVFYYKDYVYTVSGNYPYIDQYDADGQHLKTYDISHIPVINDALEFSKSQPHQENSYYIFIMDAYVDNDFIYLLCSSGAASKDYHVNTILKLSINENMKLMSTYILPHAHYSSFCVSGSSIFAAQTTRNCSIDKMTF